MESDVQRKHPLAECENCPLAEKGKYVPSSFPVKHSPDTNYGKRLAFVGESPGKQEVYKKQVFIGPSGQVLDAVIKEHGLSRPEALMTNSIACHYPEKLFDKPPKEAVTACRGRLLAELGEAEVDTVVTVGAVAATALIDSKSGITKLRAGGPRLASFSRPDGQPLTVVPTFHPAAALRDQTKFPYIVQDIAKLKPGGVWGTWKDPDYTVVTNTAVAAKWINRFIKSDYQGPLIVDTESSAEKDESFGGGINEVLCVGVWDEDTKQVIVFTPESMDRFNRRLLGKLLVARGMDGQNGKYDVVHCLNDYLSVDDAPIDIPVIFDTMLAHYCMDEGKGVHGLKYMMLEYLGAPDYEQWLKDSMEEGRAKKKAEWKRLKRPLKGMFTGVDFSLVDPPVLYRYNAFDVYGTYLLREMFKPKLVAGEVDRLFDWLMTVNTMLCHVETNGLAVDLDFNSELEVRYKQMLADIEFKGAEDINPNSWQQVLKYLDTMGIKVDSTNKTTIKALIERYEVLGRDDIVDFCQALLDHRGASKLMGTYVTGLRKSLVNGIAHPSFSLHTTSTGRTSARNPNLQNMPRESDIKKQFVPSRRGRVFVQADYGQAELRVLTWLGKDEGMRKWFYDAFLDPNPKNDVFVKLCTDMYGDRFVHAVKEARKEMRTMIKTFAYGISYGREAKAIAIAFGISVAEAKRMMNAFKAMIPGVMEFQGQLKKRVFAGDDLVNPFGRRRRFHLITDANVVTVMNEAMAFLPQSTASDICLESAVRLDKQGVEIRNLVHDSILAECEQDEVNDVAQLLSSTMVGTAEEVTEGYVKFAVDVEVGTRWGELEDFALLPVAV